MKLETKRLNVINITIILTNESCFIFIGSGELCFGNSCYVISEKGETWAENQKSCKAEGGDLVSMETEDEWQFVNSEIRNLTLPGASEWHIGLKKEGDWKWVSGSPLTIEKWQRYEPSGDGNVAVMSKDYPSGSQGLFNDLPGQIPKAFICEIPKGKMISERQMGIKSRKVHLRRVELVYFSRIAGHFI